MISAVGLVETLWYHLGVQEVSEDNELHQTLIDPQQRRISPWSLFRRRKFYSVTLVYVSARLFFNLLQVFIPAYVIETLKLPRSYITIIPLITNLSNFTTSMMTTKLNVVFGRKVSMKSILFFSLLHWKTWPEEIQNVKNLCSMIFILDKIALVLNLQNFS